ncbi:MAG: exodeoxyribonuclease III [Alphaproteobacteria bacterium]
MRIASWNINSVRLRAPIVAQLAEAEQPDVICLQETKCPDEHFPHEAIEEMGYAHRAIWGMKGYNGVCILSKQPLTDVTRYTRAGKDDCRHLSARLPDGTVVHNLYIPAGGDKPDPVANEKFAHKLAYLEELTDVLATNGPGDDKAIMVGDFNIAPLEHDVWSHKQLLKVVSHTPIEVEKLDALQASCDWLDTTRHFTPESEKLYSWWSYRARDWSKSDKGRRLDHIWITPALAPKLKAGWVIRDGRGWGEKPSDHAPVLADIAD